MFESNSWGPNLRGEALDLLVGKQIGKGQYRSVFECKVDPTLVIKVEENVNDVFSNIMEYDAWKWFHMHPKIGKWLAPCVSISYGGSVLIQKRVEPLTGKLPTKVPACLAFDMKRENWGVFNGHVVKLDYPGLRYMPEAKLMPVEWIDET